MKTKKNKKPQLENTSVIKPIPKGFLYKCKYNETPLFLAHGSVLVEINDDNRFTYRAENLKTGKAIVLGHRPDKLPEGLYWEIAERIGRSAAGNAWLLADAGNKTLISQPRLQEMLGVVFNRILPLHGFASRGKQLELAQEILTSMFGLNVLLAEAEVGTGKTLAYLIPAVIARRSRTNSGRINTHLADGSQAPIIIATSSIALQRAIEQDYIPALSDILLQNGIIKTPLTTVLRKGKGHYLCERRFTHFLAYADRETKKLLIPLEDDKIVDLAGAKGLSPYLKRAVCVDEHCGKDCPKFDICRYMRHMREAKRGGYDFQVCNHNYLLADVLRRSRDQRPLIPDYQAVVIDEAHKFLDAARSMYGGSVSFLELTDVVQAVNGFTYFQGVPTADIKRELDRITSRAGLLFRWLNGEVPLSDYGDEVPERFPTKIRERTERLIGALIENINTLKKLLGERHVIVRYENVKREAMRTLERISNDLTMFSRHKDLVYWLEEPEEKSTRQAIKSIYFPILKGIPKNMGVLLYKDLWSQKIPFILTSGTLSAAGSFERIETKLGLNLLPARRLLKTSKPSPFNHKENALIYISEAVPFPDNENSSYIEAAAAETERLFEASYGHAAVLFTSYKAMDMVYERIASRKPTYPLFRLDRGGAAAIEQFKASGNGLLFASGALWEGIDIPGDILSMLIIVRLPFAVPDPVSEWERSLYGSMGEYISNVVVPEMLIKLKQGFGRLLRIESDTGVVAILDCRAGQQRAYGQRVLSALPACRVTSNIKDVRKFFRDKKSPEYFICPKQGGQN